MRETTTGIRLSKDGAQLALVCPFHPPKRLEIDKHGHHCTIVHTPIRPGIDCFSIHLKILSGIPWVFEWEDNRLATGFIENNWAKLKLRAGGIEKLEATQWFRFSGNKLTIDRTSETSLNFHVMLCSREATKLLLEFDDADQHPNLKQFITDDHALHFTSGSMNPTVKSSAAAITESQTGGLKNRLQLEANVLIWFAETLNLPAEIDEKSGSSAINADDRDAINQIAERMTSDPGHEYSLTELCEIGNINEHKLKSAFKRIHGKTPFTYLREARMNTAARLLKQDRLSVIQVANEVGYSNASHFARAFKDQHSLLPKAFQCLHRR
ncbi:MAG: helix-turn-helix transcriptional regulator [Opitutaceae bacterium]